MFCWNYMSMELSTILIFCAFAIHLANIQMSYVLLAPRLFSISYLVLPTDQYTLVLLAVPAVTLYTAPTSDISTVALLPPLQTNIAKPAPSPKINTQAFVPAPLPATLGSCATPLSSIVNTRL